MSITIDRYHAYAFLAGLYMGGWTNIFSDAVITGLVLYITTPEIFTLDRWDRVKSYMWAWAKPVQSITGNNNIKMIEQKIEQKSGFFNFSSLPKIEIMSSPNYKK